MGLDSFLHDLDPFLLHVFHIFTKVRCCSFSTHRPSQVIVAFNISELLDKENSPDQQKQKVLANHPTKAVPTTFLTAHHGVHCTGCLTTLCLFLATLRRRHVLAQFLQCHSLGTRHARSSHCLAAHSAVPPRRTGCCCTYVHIQQHTTKYI